MSRGYIAVDLDGTLAQYNGWKGPEHIGEPVPLMVERVKKWLAEGQEVKIFTARVAKSNPDRLAATIAINTWSKKHIGKILEVTAEKDYGMIALWDDRCVQVIPNTGMTIGDVFAKGLKKNE
jgi:hypothetical protein